MPYDWDITSGKGWVPALDIKSLLGMGHLCVPNTVADLRLIGVL